MTFFFNKDSYVTNRKNSRKVFRRAVLSTLIATLGTGNALPVAASDSNFPHVYIGSAAVPSDPSAPVSPIEQVARSLPAGINLSETDDPQVISSDDRPSFRVSLAEARSRVFNSNPELDAFSSALAAVAEGATIADAAFDGQIGMSIRAGKNDRQRADQVATLGLPSTDLQTDFIESEDGNLFSYTRRTRTGGQFLLGYGNEYRFLDPIGPQVLVNPAWEADINFRYSQQLFQGRRREVNEAPIRLVQLEYASLSHDLRALVNTYFRDVEVAYWTFAGQFKALQAAADATKRFEQLLNDERARLEEQETTTVDVAQVDERYQTIRLLELELRRAVKLASVELMRLMGDPQGSTVDIIPVDIPGNVQTIDFHQGMMQAGFRPELDAKRDLIRLARTELLVARDALRPNLSANFGYTMNGLENRLDDAIDTLLDGDYQDWFIGLEFQQPVGNRAAYAGVRRACRLVSSYQAELETVRRDVYAQVHAAAVDLDIAEQALAINEQRVLAAQQQVDGRRELYDNNKGTVDLLVRSEQALVDAQVESINAIFAYQQALSQWRFATGAIDQTAFGLEPSITGQAESIHLSPTNGEPTEAAEPVGEEIPPAPPIDAPNDNAIKAVDADRKANDNAQTSSPDFGSVFVPVVSNPHVPGFDYTSDSVASSNESFGLDGMIDNDEFGGPRPEVHVAPAPQSTSQRLASDQDDVTVNWQDVFIAQERHSADESRVVEDDGEGFPKVHVAPIKFDR